MKKLLALFLVLVMCFALLPSALGEGEDDFSDQTLYDQSIIDHEEESECDHECDGCDADADEMLTDIESIESQGNEAGDQTEEDSKALKYTYDPDLAIAQAPALLDTAIYNDGKCASYVSSVLRAGGLTNVNQSGAGDLIDYLNLNASSHFGGSIGKVIVNPTGNQLHKGDVLCVVCYNGGNSTDYTNGHSKGSGKYWGQHVVIVSEVVSNSKVKYYAANTTHYNDTLTLSSYASYFTCGKCNSKKYMKLIAFCFNDNVKGNASCNLNAYYNFSGKNYLYGSDFNSLDSYYWYSRDTSVSNISIDSSNQHNGYNALKIVNSSAGANKKDLQIRAMTKGNVKQDRYAAGKGENNQMILSFWAKSSKAGTKMYFRWGYEKTSAYRFVSLTTDWAKYTVQMNKKSYFNCGIYPYINAAGTVWVTEMQLEDGTTATDFVPENGGLYATTTSTYGGNYTMPSTPSRTGYTFNGWYTTPSGGTQITSSTAVKAGHFNVYAHWTKNTDYLASCTEYPTYGTVTTKNSTTLKTLPCSKSTNASSADVATLSSGQTLTVNAVFKNTAGNYWYRVSYNGQTCYLYSGDTTWKEWLNSDITQDNAEYPSSITMGEDFQLKGTIKATYNQLNGIYAYVYNGSATSGTAVISSSATGLAAKSFSMYNSTLDNNLRFDSLSAGNYTFVLRLKCKYHYSNDGKTLTSTISSETLKHSNTFTVVGNTVTVTFNANGGTVSPTSKTVTVGSTYGNLPTPMRTGYEFVGWFTAPDGGTLITETTTVTTTSNHTLYAWWAGELCSFDLAAYVDGMFDGDYYVDGEYTDDFEGLFTYDLYLGGTQIDDDTTNAHDDFAYGTHYEIKDIKPAPGKRFDGVHIGSLSGTITGDTMIVLLFSTEKYTVTFNANGGTVSPTSKTVTYGSKYGDLPTPTRTGYTFNGWYTAASGGSKITSSTTVTTASNHTLYAHWELNAAEFDGTVEWNDDILMYRGSTPYVIYDGYEYTPAFTVKDDNGNVIDPAYYDYEYVENTAPGTGYVIVTFKGDYSGTAQAWFKIYLPATTETTIENVSDGIKLTWEPVEGAAGYVVYRRAWSSTTDGWTTFERWNNTTGTTYVDGADAGHKVYAGTRYQYGVKAYFARRVDPVSGATIGGNVGDNYNLGEVGPLKTTVRITTRVLNSVTPGSRQLTVKWAKSSVFTGYQLQYATDAAFTKNVNAIKIPDPKSGEKILTGLKAKTTYYVRVRSYHEFNGMTYFGEWSNVISAKTK